MIKKQFIFPLSLVLFLLLLLKPDQTPGTENGPRQLPPFLESTNSVWADSVLGTMTSRQKIGQLFMVAAYSNKTQSHVDTITMLIKDQHIGGLIFFQGGPVRQAIQTNYYQSISKVPLMISIDGEWGLAMRLDSTIRFPRQMTLGAISDEKIIYEMGAEIARQCKRLGIHVNLAPVADINNNSKNPVILSRSFGENKHDVARKTLYYMKGMQDNGVMANAKHFPGHGDTDTDSHKALPVINTSKARLDSLELFPFKHLIDNGLGSMMVAHLYIPKIDSTPNTASTLSSIIVTDMLKTELGFQGLIFTDALNMKGVSSYFAPGIVDVKALLAGNDVLLFPENVPKAIDEIEKAIERNEITLTQIEARVRKILMAKAWQGLDKYTPIDLNNLYEDLNPTVAQWLNTKLFRSSLTLLKNSSEILPFKDLEKNRMASLVINDKKDNLFQKTLGMYAPVSNWAVPSVIEEKLADSLANFLSEYENVIISIHNTTTRPDRNFGISDQTNKLIRRIQEKTNVILVVFGNPYTIDKLNIGTGVKAVMLAYEDTDIPQQEAAQALFGAIPVNGKLPVTINKNYPIYAGLIMNGGSRLAISMPEEIGLPTASFAKIDNLVAKGIKAGAMPGCQILIAKDGKVIWNKAYGNTTYESKITVKTTDLYDIASITKIASTALLTMKMVEEDKIDLDKKIYRYLPEFKKTNKKDIEIQELLSHSAGLKAWIPFYSETLKNGGLDPVLYRREPTEGFGIKVADSVYLQTAYAEKIWDVIKDSPVTQSGTMVYSDLGMLIMQRIIEEKSCHKLDDLASEKFYAPLGLTTMGYLPLSRFPLDRIIPTENDTKFRGQLLRGYVHDPASAMLGGVSGHAGLFSDAWDLAVIMQMLMNGGTYGEEKFLKPSTIDLFTKAQHNTSKNRRGLIFDKPEPDISKNGPTARNAPPSTFGHTGFTGTCTWADPDNGLVFVFLSNRVYPDAGVNKLATMNIRTDIQQAIYEVLVEYGMYRNEIEVQ